MAKVLCRLPNASNNINGVRFVTHRDGMLSEEIEDEVALGFANIRGYEIYDPDAANKQSTQNSTAAGETVPPAGTTPTAPTAPTAPGAATSTPSGAPPKPGAQDPTF